MGGTYMPEGRAATARITTIHAMRLNDER
jgi:hypothetical protein